MDFGDIIFLIYLPSLCVCFADAGKCKWILGMLPRVSGVLISDVLMEHTAIIFNHLALELNMCCNPQNSGSNFSGLILLCKLLY